MPINYPSTLPDFKMGKQRSQQQTFRTSQPFNGPMYIEKFTDESPVAWNVTIDCRNQIQARQFQAFLRAVANGQPFNKFILTEEGYIEHEVRFIEIPLNPTQKNQFLWSYSAVIYAVALIQPDALIDDELIYTWLQDADIIDNALNNLWGLPAEIPRIESPVTHLLSTGQAVVKLDGDLTTIRSTIGTYIDRNDGILKVAAIDEFREESEGYLIEGGSTNSVLHSEDFSDAVWTGVATVTPNSAISPDGTMTADLIDVGLPGTGEYKRQVVTVGDDSLTRVFSVFCKAGSNDECGVRLRYTGGTVVDVSVTFDTISKSFLIIDPQATLLSHKELPNGWFRLFIGIANNSSGNTVLDMRVSAGTAGALDSGTAYFWGAQKEDKPLASSYIKTTSIAVTRNTDIISFDRDENLPGLPLTLVMTIRKLGDTGGSQFPLTTGGAGGDDLFINANTDHAAHYTGSFLNSGETVVDNVPYIVSTVFSSGESLIYVDGVEKDSNTTVITAPPIDEPSVFIGSTTAGSNNFFGHIKDLRIYDFKATEEEIEFISGV
jgi:hypothetical protein